VLLVLSLFSIFVIPRNSANQQILDTELREQIDNSTPAIPADMVPPSQEEE